MDSDGLLTPKTIMVFEVQYGFFQSYDSVFYLLSLSLILKFFLTWNILDSIVSLPILQTVVKSGMPCCPFISLTSFSRTCLF